MRINEVDKQVTQADIDQLERFADKLFAKVGIDVEFTRHFIDRVNDERNVKQITMSELTRLFKQEFKRWGKPIAQMGPDAEAVMKDLATDINMPFALRWDRKNNELDLIAKTVMRKQDFKTSNPEFAIENVKQSGALKVINNIAQRKENDPFPIKFSNGKLIYVKPITARKILYLLDVAKPDIVDKFMTYINTVNGFRELANYANEKIKGTVKEEYFLSKKQEKLINESYIAEQAMPQPSAGGVLGTGLDAQQFQQRYGVTPKQATTSVGNVIKLRPGFKAPRVANAITNYMLENPSSFQAANDNVKPNRFRIPGFLRGLLPRLLGGIGMILMPTPAGDPNEDEIMATLNDIHRWMMYNDPQALIDMYDAEWNALTDQQKEDMADWNPANDPNYQNAKDAQRILDADKRYRDRRYNELLDRIYDPRQQTAPATNPVEPEQPVDPEGEPDPDLPEPANDPRPPHIRPNTPGMPDPGKRPNFWPDSIPFVSPDAAPEQPLQPEPDETPNVDPKDDPKPNRTPPEFDPFGDPEQYPEYDPKTPIDPGPGPEVDPTAPEQPKAPDGDPEKSPEYDPTQDPEIDPTQPEELPKQDPDTSPAEIPQTSPKPEVDPTSPEQPEPDTDPDGSPSGPKPEEPVTRPAEIQPLSPTSPAEQPPEELPAPNDQPIVNPQPEIPQVTPNIDNPPSDLPSIDTLPDLVPPIGLTDPKPDTDVAVDPKSATPPTSGGKKSNNNNNRKNRRYWDWGTSDDLPYDDPLQRWVKKYGQDF